MSACCTSGPVDNGRPWYHYHPLLSLSVSLSCPLAPFPNAHLFSSETSELHKSLTYFFHYLFTILQLLVIVVVSVDVIEYVVCEQNY